MFHNHRYLSLFLLFGILFFIINPFLVILCRSSYNINQGSYWSVSFREKVTRHLYYLQLKENLLHYNHVCSEGKCFQMVSYALQADFGNYSSEKHAESYFDPREYFPAWVFNLIICLYNSSNRIYKFTIYKSFCSKFIQR